MARDAPAVCAVLVGTAASEEKASRLAASLQDCPFAANVTAAGNLVCGVFAMPESRRWWVEDAAASPEVWGLSTAAAFVTDRVAASIPWSRGETAPLS